ncbi:MAG: ABC transporter ATP-binding protein [Muribaculaceae bacterium]|nr:ABC transporter ATP-binding protein [Muribaculaceae bacterium]
MLEVKQLTFSYPGKRNPVLSGISLSVSPGGVYGLLGKNGVGKSTLLYLIAGLLTPQSGSVELFGANTRERQPRTLADIFIVPEVVDLPKVTLKEYVETVAPFYPKFSREDMHRYLATFEMDADVHLGRLSMGQLKKVFMSFALAANTPLLLMDEPTNGLDIPAKAAFRGFVASGMTDERSIIISTHQVQDINLLLDHVVIMENSGVLLNQPVSRIIEKLAFDLTDDRALIESSLYAMPSIQGTSVVNVSDGTRETPLNLETLFNLTTTRPEVVKAIFSEE